MTAPPPVASRPCPTCRRILDHTHHRHCARPYCRWLRCGCRTIVDRTSGRHFVTPPSAVR